MTLQMFWSLDGNRPPSVSANGMKGCGLFLYEDKSFLVHSSRQYSLPSKLVIVYSSVFQILLLLFC